MLETCRSLSQRDVPSGLSVWMVQVAVQSVAAVGGWSMLIREREEQQCARCDSSVILVRLHQLEAY